MNSLMNVLIFLNCYDHVILFLENRHLCDREYLEDFSLTLFNSICLKLLDAAFRIQCLQRA